VTHSTHLFGLPNVSDADLEPVAAAEVAVATHKFSQCMKCGEAFHRLGVHGAKVLILVVALFLPSVVQHLREVLESQSAGSLLPCTILHSP
jgi:hypothetical protein